MRARVRRLTAAVRELLHQESAARWDEGWSLAERLGPPALPALRAAWQAETNRLQRWGLLGACVTAAAGGERVAWLAELAGQRARSQEERGLALLALALLPGEAGGGDLLATLVATERPDTWLHLGAALAATRAGARLSPAGARHGAGHAEAVAAALAGSFPLELVERASAALGDAREALAAGLVLRAWCLGRAGADPGLLRAALALAARQDAAEAVRGAAALFAANADPGAAASTLGTDPALRATLVAVPAARRALWTIGRLGPVPELFAVPKVRVALAVGYALSAPWGRLWAEAAEWGKEPALADAVLLALAWRTLAEDQSHAPPPAELAARPGEAASWFGLATGATQPPGVWSAQPADARAARVAELARRQQLDRVDLARELEDLLWRRGLHPGLAAERAWTDLVRDCLLAGSQYVSARLQLPLEQRPPLPRDIEDSHDKLFRCADALFRYLTERAPGPPPALRLR